jgi:oligopeptide transport system ATP-binding protein
LIADEPTTALDVTVQAQIMELLAQIQRDNDTGMVLITHDLGVVADVAQRVTVMYAGRIMEHGTVERIFSRPANPYTAALLASVPRIDERRQRITAIGGLPPSLANPPAGCAFHPRCPMAQGKCRQDPAPPLASLPDGQGPCLEQREVSRCWFPQEVVFDGFR